MREIEDIERRLDALESRDDAQSKFSASLFNDIRQRLGALEAPEPVLTTSLMIHAYKAFKGIANAWSNGWLDDPDIEPLAVDIIYQEMREAVDEWKEREEEG